VAAFRGPASVGEAMRQAVAGTGYSHYLGTFVGGQVVLASAAEGPQSPYLEDLVPGFDDGAHATALGKALLATLTPDQRLRYLKDWGMRPYTSATFTQPEALEADLSAGDRRGMQIEISQYRAGVGCAAVLVRGDRDPERGTSSPARWPRTSWSIGARNPQNHPSVPLGRRRRAWQREPRHL
jgi:DNA-binding IclR family transcriptional regulator